MTADDVIAAMRAAGVTVIAGPRLSFPPTIPTHTRRFILIGVREFRDAVLAAFPPPPAEVTWEGPCEVCGRLVAIWDGNWREVYRLCRLAGGSIVCPWWNEEVAADWERATRERSRGSYRPILEERRRRKRP